MPSNATETIDVRILRLIGLEDTFDLDYDTYLTLLKEAAVKGRMPKTTIPPEEVELLTDEWKRVKTKKDKGRFKVKKKKITSTKLKTGGILTGKKTSIPTSKLLSAAQAGGAGGFNIGESFAKIAESVTSIANTLRQKNKLSKKDSEFDRRTEEREKRKLQKQNLKKRFAKMAAVAQKIMQPVQSLLDKIINYFVMIFLGNAVLKLVKWFTNKENQGKVKSFVRFIGDWWPALLGGFLLFGTGFGGLIATFVPTIVGWTVKLGAVIGGSALLKTALAAAGLVTAGAWLPKLIPGLVDEDVKPGGPGDHSWGGYEDQQRRTTNQAQKGGPGDYSWGGYEGNKSQKIQGLNNGGWIVPGSGTGDTVSAMLTPGESVLQVGARERLIEQTGVDPLSANIGPNANKPKIMGGTMFASSGGMVGKESGSYKIPPWNQVGASVMSGLSNALTTLNVEGSKLHGMVTRGNYGLSGGSMGGGGILSNLNKEGAKLHGFLTRGNYGLSGGSVGGGGILSNISSAFGSAKEWIGSKAEGLKNSRYPGENWAIERERKLGLMEPGADSLTKETRAKLKSHDDYIRGLSGIRKSIENKGFIPDPFMLLKTEGAEKLVQNLSGGRIKNLGAKLTGLQYASKGLLGPLGRAFRIDDMGSLGRYLKPAMEEAQKQGHGSVGRKALGGETYDRLVGDRLANLALGQTQFRVGKDGRAITDDTYDSNMTAEFYLKKSREALKSGDMGTALFNGLSGLLRVNQNTGWGNLRPGGLGIDLGEGYNQTDSSGKVLPQAQISPQQKPKTAPPPPHTSVIDPIHGHEIRTFEGGTGEWPSDPSPATPTNPVISMISGWADKLNVLGLGG